MSTFKRKMTSRKLWAAIALFVSGILVYTGHGDKAESIAGLIMQGAAVVAYIVGEGLADSSNANIGEPYEIEYEESEEEE